jgi:FKBP-type peptidyl-prolyl cis-trans isomerase
MKLPLLFILLLPLQAFAFSPAARLTTRPRIQKTNVGPRCMAESDDAVASEYTPGQTTLFYIDEVMGEGEGAAEGDVMVIKFVGKVMSSGNQFITSDSFPFEVGEGKSLPGFDEGLKGAQVGTKRILKVPPSKAFGPQGSGSVPPNSDVEFECEVLSIARSPLEKTMAKIGLQRASMFGLSMFLIAAAPAIDKFVHEIKL